MRHAFTGVFFRDLMVDRPFEDPLHYAFEYYAKYPALGVPHWPPFFYVVEGVFYLLFGISVLTSRIVVLIFALMAVYFWYRIAERTGPRRLAVISAFIFPLVPYILLYERVTMLEIPMFGLCLGALHFWLRFLESERSVHLWALAGFLAAAILTSQKSVFVAFFIVLHFLMERRFRLLLRWQVWVAGAACVAAVAPWYVLATRTLTMSLDRAVSKGFSHAANTSHLTFYWNHLPRQLIGGVETPLGIALGWTLMVLGLAGMAWALLFAARRHRLLLLWVFATYVFFTLIREKDQRHTMMWIPVLVYFALLALEALFAHRRWALVACSALAAGYLVNALQFDRPRLSGMEDIARFVAQQPDSDLVYFQGPLNGDYIFFTRLHDPERQRMVVRDKQIVATRVIGQYGRREFMSTPEQVLDLFRTWGIRYAVIQERPRSHDLEIVDTALASGAFERIAEFTLRSNNAEVDGQKIHVYRYTGPIERSTEPVVIPMLTLREHIRADLNRLVGRPWPN